MTSLAGALDLASFERHALIFSEAALESEAHILLKGIARITCQNARDERITIALLAPGPIPEFPSLSVSRFGFRCEAYDECRVGSLSWNDFDGITAHNSALAFKKFHQNDLQQWYRLLLRSGSFLNLGLHERVAITLLELSSDFGIEDARGTLLRPSFSHQDIADLVGASRPRVTEHLAQLERDHLLIRQGRRLIVRVDEIGKVALARPSRESGSRANPFRKRPGVAASNKTAKGRNSRKWSQAGAVGSLSGAREDVLGSIDRPRIAAITLPRTDNTLP